MSLFRRRLMMVHGGQSGISGGVSVNNATNGIYVYADSKLFTLEEWDINNNNKAVGVAIVNKSHPDRGFIISPNKDILGVKWSRENETVNGVSTCTDLTTARFNYSGFSDTEHILSSYPSATDIAAYYCRKEIFLNKKNGYLGSFGEWNLVRLNLDKINNTLLVIDGYKLFDQQYYDSYLTSTQYSRVQVWSIKNNQYDYSEYSGKTSIFNMVRPFCKLK